jgi:hypothetical protein
MQAQSSDIQERAAERWLRSKDFDALRRLFH